MSWHPPLALGTAKGPLRTCTSPTLAVVGTGGDPRPNLEDFGIPPLTTVPLSENSVNCCIYYPTPACPSPSDMVCAGFCWLCPHGQPWGCSPVTSMSCCSLPAGLVSSPCTFPSIWSRSCCIPEHSAHLWPFWGKKLLETTKKYLLKMNFPSYRALVAPCSSATSKLHWIHHKHGNWFFFTPETPRMLWAGKKNK